MEVKVNGVKIYCQKLGKKHPLILLHGYRQDGGIFDKLVASLFLYYIVVAPDMWDHGLSEGEVSEHYQTEVEDLRASTSALKLERPYILGFGSEGLVTLFLVTQAPESISKIIAAGTYVNGNSVNVRHIAANTTWDSFKGDRDSRAALRESHIPAETLKRIETPTLCVVDEEGWVKVEHVR